jgi:hypothetical protein
VVKLSKELQESHLILHQPKEINHTEKFHNVPLSEFRGSQSATGFSYKRVGPAMWRSLLVALPKGNYPLDLSKVERSKQVFQTTILHNFIITLKYI